MYYIDSHTHIYREYFPSDLEATIENAVRAGVEKMILPCVNLETMDDLLEISAKYPKNLFPLTGLHPTDVNENYQQELDALATFLSHPQIVGVGEIGMDLYHSTQFVAEQLVAFETQLNWAADCHFPLSIHIRNGYNEAFSVLSKFKSHPLKGVLHCFSGGIQEAKWAVDHGFLLGISGVVTFKKNKLQDIVKEVGLQHIALETDAPFLAPVPFRGKRNEPAYIPHIAEHIANVLETSIEEVLKTTTHNIENIFDI